MVVIKWSLMDIYTLSRNFFNWSFENPEKINPNHIALYFFCIEQCNRLGWKDKFGLPATMAKEAIGIRSYNTYKKTLDDLVEFGFIKMIEVSKNQYSSNIIAISKFNKAYNKALDNALIKHTSKQSESTRQSIDSIDIQEYNSTIIQDTNTQSDIDSFIQLRKNIFNEYDTELKTKLSKYKIDRPICFIGTGIPVMYYDLVEILVICINDIEWQKDIQNRFGLLKYEKSLIDFFLTVKASSEYTKYKGENDFKRHYTNWLNKNTDKYKK
jgi:hypothetical protein